VLIKLAAEKKQKNTNVNTNRKAEETGGTNTNGAYVLCSILICTSGMCVLCGETITVYFPL